MKLGSDRGSSQSMPARSAREKMWGRVDAMPMTKILQQAKSFEIQAFERPQGIKNLKLTHVPFSGSLYQHFYDEAKIVLLVDPYSSSNFYMEFRRDDIDYLEELANISSPDGKTIVMSRIWVKKGAVAMRCTPFRVDDFTRN